MLSDWKDPVVISLFSAYKPYLCICVCVCVCAFVCVCGCVYVCACVRVCKREYIYICACDYHNNLGHSGEAGSPAGTGRNWVSTPSDCMPPPAVTDREPLHTPDSLWQCKES